MSKQPSYRKQQIEERKRQRRIRKAARRKSKLTIDVQTPDKL